MERIPGAWLSPHDESRYPDHAGAVGMVLEHAEGDGTRIVGVSVGAVRQQVLLGELAGLVDIDASSEMEVSHVFGFEAGDSNPIDGKNTERQT
ncbi:hypothetical protein [Agreia sp. VKM Ac-1783]|uniref:hypothetical protein n=1 Tax=Agreia sp. VKM Ac-1783 TaxID=1938889 RepID=UPI0032C3F019